MFLDAQITRTSPEGHFYIDLRRQLDVYLRYAPWSDGLRVYRHERGRWIPEPRDPDIPLINPAHSAAPGLPIHDFLSSVPEPVRRQAAAFSYLQTTLLRLCAVSRHARDLSRDIPILLWLAAEAINGNIWPDRMIAELLGRKRKAILETILGKYLPGSIRFLKKIRIFKGESDELRLVAHALRTGLADSFRHWKTVPMPVLAIVQRFPGMAGSRLISNFGNRDYSTLCEAISDAHPTGRLFEDVHYMGRALEIGDASRTLMNCPSLEALNRIHDRWTVALNKRKTIASSGAEFPPPPIPGNEDIHPIRTVDDLLAEGRLMHHCVGGYVEKVMQRKCYLYRVTRPERATLEIAGRSGNLSIAQVRLSYNRLPAKRTYKVVREWLEESLSKKRA